MCKRDIFLVSTECGCDDAAVRRDMCPELHSIQTNYAHSDGKDHAKSLGRADGQLHNADIAGAQAATVMKINMTSNVTDWKVRKPLTVFESPAKH